MKLLDKYGAVGGEVGNTKRGALGERETIGQTEDGLRFASNVLGVRSTSTGEEHPITHLFIIHHPVKHIIFVSFTVDANLGKSVLGKLILGIYSHFILEFGFSK